MWAGVDDLVPTHDEVGRELLDAPQLALHGRLLTISESGRCPKTGSRWRSAGCSAVNAPDALTSFCGDSLGHGTCVPAAEASPALERHKQVHHIWVVASFPAAGAGGRACPPRRQRDGSGLTVSVRSGPCVRAARLRACQSLALSRDALRICADGC